MCQFRLYTEPDVPKVRSCGDGGILLQSSGISEPFVTGFRGWLLREYDRRRGGMAQRDSGLLKRTKKFQSEDLQIA
jgi:hypothetical protein